MPMDRHGLGHGHRGERQAASVHMFVPHSWPITGVQVRPSQLYEIIYYCIYIYIGVCDLLIKIQHYCLHLLPMGYHILDPYWPNNIQVPVFPTNCWAGWMGASTAGDPPRPADGSAVDGCHWTRRTREDQVGGSANGATLHPRFLNFCPCETVLVKVLKVNPELSILQYFSFTVSQEFTERATRC